MRLKVYFFLAKKVLWHYFDYYYNKNRRQYVSICNFCTSSDWVKSTGESSYGKPIIFIKLRIAFALTNLLSMSSSLLQFVVTVAVVSEEDGEKELVMPTVISDVS